MEKIKQKISAYYVIKGVHKDPNDKSTMDVSTLKQYGPVSPEDADELARSLIQRNIDNYYHRAWVIEE